VQIALSAMTTGGVVTALLSSHEIELAAKIVSALLSTALLVVNAYAKDIDPGQQSEKHKETASALWDVRESYLALIADLRQGSLDTEAVREKRDELQAALARIYRSAPRTTAKAYRSAQVGLQQNEELTFSDAELDGMLPPALRKTRDA
jgi:hypothetical protein